jgi:branched-chain amino acid transport system ATP-binding protein
MSAAALKLTAVETGYDRLKVLKGISLSVPDGKVVGIVGPNGHGKTTLLRAISGLVPLWSGQIFLSGIAIHNLPAHQRVALGLVQIPQGDMVFADMTVEENLRLGAILAPDNDEIVRRLDIVFGIFPRLLERREQVARTLSGGERRMLGIGRGLMSAGQVMLVDEPSLGLAPKLIDQVYDALHNLKKITPTLIVVEESPERLQQIADYVYVIDDGEFVWNGSPASLRENAGLLTTYLGA